MKQCCQNNCQPSKARKIYNGINRMKWFAQGFYTVAEKDGKIRIYNMQCDMQGVREFGNYKAPTAFYYEITPKENGDYDLTSGMYLKE